MIIDMVGKKDKKNKKGRGKKGKKDKKGKKGKKDKGGDMPPLPPALPDEVQSPQSMMTSPDTSADMIQVDMPPDMAQPAPNDVGSEMIQLPPPDGSMQMAPVDMPGAPGKKGKKGKKGRKGSKGKGKKGRKGKKGKGKKGKKEGGFMRKIEEAILGPRPESRHLKRSSTKEKKKDNKIVIHIGDARSGQTIVLEDIDYSSDRFEEIESYPVLEPFAYVRILYDKKTFNKIYHVVEPDLTRKDKKIIEEIKKILIKIVDVQIEKLDNNPEKYLRKMTRAIIRAYNMPVKKEEFDKLFYYIRRDMLGYGNIDVLTLDPNIEDISCDGPFTPVYIYDRRYESLETTIRWLDESELDSYVIRLAQRCNKHISMAEPLIDATLMDGSRIVMTLGRDISTRGSTFTIRKFRDEPFTPTDLIDFNTMSALIVSYLWMAIQHGMSALVCGGTASGKTTTLNALALFIPREMKIVSIEETRELNLPHPNWIPGCTREGFGGETAPGVKAPGAVDMYDLLKAALRERPEYIVVGEIRGAEAYVLFQAMSTGHTTYSTVHADSIPSLVHRLENKPIEIPRVMIPALDLASIQIQTRIGEKRVRRAKQIVEIIGLDPHTEELLTNEVFRWIPATDEYEFSGKSYVLEKIMVKTNLNKEQITNEMKNRQELLDWLVEKDIRKHTDFSRVVAEYYVRPERVMSVVRGELPESAIFGEEEIQPQMGGLVDLGMGGAQIDNQIGQDLSIGMGDMSMDEMEVSAISGDTGLDVAAETDQSDTSAPLSEVSGNEDFSGDKGGRTLICPTCGAYVDENASECPVCGEKFGEGVMCPTCGSMIPPDAEVCPVCGESFSQTTEGEGPPTPSEAEEFEMAGGSALPDIPEKSEIKADDDAGDIPAVSGIRYCPVCGSEVPPGESTCPQCGEPM